MKNKLKNGDKIKTIFGNTAIILSIPKDESELTKLDKQIKIGYYQDGVDCFSSFIVSTELYEILDKSK